MYEYFSLRVTKDKMKAYLTVLYNNLEEDITYENVIDFLNMKKITFGVCTDDIQDAIENKKMISNFLVAKGRTTSVKTSEIINFMVDPHTSVIPMYNEKGIVNFEKQQDAVYVHSGDVIATVGTPDERFNCTDVYGNNYIIGKSEYIPDFGQGIKFDMDTGTVYAAIDGYVHYRKKYIDVIPMEVEKNSVSDKSYDGNVIIYSDLENCGKISTAGNIVIYGRVHNTIIEAKGDIVIRGGVDCDKKSMLKADGNIIICGTVLNMTLYCGGYISCTGLIKCIAKAGKAIYVDGNIKSGRYTAGERVIAKTLGNPTTYDLIIYIWDNWYDIENGTGKDIKTLISDYEIQLEELKEKYVQLDKSMNTIKSIDYVEGSATNINRAMLIKQVSLARAQVMNAIVKCKSEYDKIVETSRSKKLEIACSGDIFKGVQFRIGQASYTVPDKTSNRLFYLSGDSVFLYKQYK